MPTIVTDWPSGPLASRVCRGDGLGGRLDCWSETDLQRRNRASRRSSRACDRAGQIGSVLDSVDPGPGEVAPSTSSTARIAAATTNTAPTSTIVEIIRSRSAGRLVGR